MKISADNREGFEQARGAYSVYVDGKKITHVIAVDTDAGIAWVHDTTAHAFTSHFPEVEVRGAITLEPIA